MLRRRVAVIALVAIGLSACGDDALSGGELRARATTICARTAAATDRIAMPSTPAQGERFLREGLAQLRPAAAQLAALKAPAPLRARWAHAVGLAQLEVRTIADQAHAIAHGEDVIAVYRRLERELAPLVRRENAAWRGLDVPACVRR